MKKRTFTGWKEYRYGSKKKLPLAPIYCGEERKRTVTDIMDMMRDWRLSPFENEGATRHGIRSALCLKGNEWSRADLEAGSLVAEALHLLGAVRPDWIEGQWHYSIPSDYCAWCHSTIDDEGQARAYRYCSVECARYALEHRVYENHKHHDRAGAAAYRTILKLQSPSRECKYCAKSFHSSDKTAQFCSPACVRRSRGDLLNDRECLWCKTVFHPSDHSMHCCSKSCAQKQKVKEFRDENPERTCTHCHSVFRPGRAFAMYCSPSCASTVANREYRFRNRMRRATVITLEVFDYHFTKPINTRWERRLTPQRLDGLFISQGLRVTMEVAA